MLPTSTSHVWRPPLPPCTALPWGGGVHLPPIPRRQRRGGKFFLWLQWSCSGVQFGSSHMLPFSGGGGGFGDRPLLGVCGHPRVLGGVFAGAGGRGGGGWHRKLPSQHTLPVHLVLCYKSGLSQHTCTWVGLDGAFTHVHPATAFDQQPISHCTSICGLMVCQVCFPVMSCSLLFFD